MPRDERAILKTAVGNLRNRILELEDKLIDAGLVVPPYHGGDPRQLPLSLSPQVDQYLERQGIQLQLPNL